MKGNNARISDQKKYLRERKRERERERVWGTKKVD